MVLGFPVAYASQFPMALLSDFMVADYITLCCIALDYMVSYSISVYHTVPYDSDLTAVLELRLGPSGFVRL